MAVCAASTSAQAILTFVCARACDRASNVSWRSWRPGTPTSLATLVSLRPSAGARARACAAVVRRGRGRHVLTRATWNHGVRALSRVPSESGFVGDASFASSTRGPRQPSATASSAGGIAASSLPLPTTPTTSARGRATDVDTAAGQGRPPQHDRNGSDTWDTPRSEAQRPSLHHRRRSSAMSAASMASGASALSGLGDSPLRGSPVRPDLDLGGEDSAVLMATQRFGRTGGVRACVCWRLHAVIITRMAPYA